MASVRFRDKEQYWEIRKYVTDPKTRKPQTFTEILPASATRVDVAKVADRLDQQAQAIRTGKWRLPDSPQRAYNEWLRYIANKPVGRKRKMLTAGTQSHYKRVVDEFLSSLPGRIKRITQLTPNHVEAYNNKLLDRGLCARTVNANLTAIKSWAWWLNSIYGIENFAAEVLMYTENEPDQRFLTDEEYPVILAAGSEVFRQRFEFIGNTGVRATEFCQLRWKDITPDRQSIKVHGKGNKTRYVPLNSICLRILETIKKQTPPLGANQTIFLSKSNSHGNLGGPIERRVLHLQCQHVNETLHLEPFGPHAFRHYFATMLLVKGVPVAHVSKILGHSSIKTTETIYAHILPRHLAEVTECLCG
ncbi:MAG: tyrosine-type recombinase/integrase [Planctomycetaceae bacterium]|nr:tyrosine-type recombinase/integrase [Planctomycetaceae bacterium]